MPSSPVKETDSRISYTRWEPVNGNDEEDGGLVVVNTTSDANQNRVQFHRFEEDTITPSCRSQRTGLFGFLPRSIRHSFRRRDAPKLFVLPGSVHEPVGQRVAQTGDGNLRLWNIAIRILAVSVIFGFGWLVGFLVRWGVHHFVVDHHGHCVTPVPYTYYPETAKEMMDMVNRSSIEEFLKEFTWFTSNFDHSLGSAASEEYAKNISMKVKEFGFTRVEVDAVNERVPKQSRTMATEVVIESPDGTVVWREVIREQRVVYSPNAIAKGRLTYAHYGRVSDFHGLRSKFNMTFEGATVIIKTSHKYHTGSMVRNAEVFGAKAVILFPDPMSYIITDNGLGKVPDTVALSYSVKYFPGDPRGPFVSDRRQSDNSPNIPVVSLSYESAKTLLRNFTNAFGLDKAYWFSLPLTTSKELNFTASVEVSCAEEPVTLHNVLATIPGRYEPTRYVIVGSHHDTFFQGASKPGVGHSVLLELARILGYFHGLGWTPGRSLILASWDGEEHGNLGSTSWMLRHSKELASRAVAYINLENLLQGGDKLHVGGSPLFTKIIKLAAKSVSCARPPSRSVVGEDDDHCTLYDEWLREVNLTEGSPFRAKEDRVRFLSGSSAFQNVLGVTSMEVSLRNRHFAAGDSYPFVRSSLDTQTSAQRFLDLGQAAAVTKFLLVVVLRLVNSAQMPLDVQDYAEDVLSGLDSFLELYADDLLQDVDGDPPGSTEPQIRGVRAQDLRLASKGFARVARRFHSEYNPVPALELLGHHEFNDQMLELERSFLMPPFSPSRGSGSPGLSESLLSGWSFRHVIHGPSPLNLAQTEFFPRLSAAIQLAKMENTSQSWNAVRRETFLVVDALESARCVLDNHLIHFPDPSEDKET